ncbi:hypothetical protein ACFYKX_05420 [Cytobacillus sp. FJAT-54145]|uniref:Uncharacterized protein n=1 Tax=Cytobacillus spartinae TaxID=3299023 RepID=A0ABW6K7B0_9BACI
MKKTRSILSFLVLFFGLFYYFVQNHPHYHSTMTDSNHLNHGFVEIPEGTTSPKVDVRVSQDLSGTYYLKVTTYDFTFAPEKVGSMTPSFQEGHAHLYINGEKVNRLYGEYYNIGSLKPGRNVVKVSLHSNNHGALFFKGKPIEKSIVVEVQS